MSTHRELQRRLLDPLNPPDIQVLREVLKRGLKWEVPLYNADTIEGIALQLARLGQKPDASEEDRTVASRAFEMSNAIRTVRIEQLRAEHPIFKILRNRQRGSA